jgi:GT2 family glycosyltransferase
VTSVATLGPRILILLPVHNRRVTTALFIGCLLAQTYTNWHLVLIDDGSTDGTADMVRREVPSVTVLHGTGDWWWGGALQQGYLWLTQHPEHGDDLILIINDDTEFASDFLELAVRATKPRSLLLAQLYDQHGQLLEAGVRWNWRDCNWVVAQKSEGGPNCFSTRGLFLWMRDFLTIGGFHPLLLPHYLSDYEFTMRAHRKGFALISSPAVHLCHRELLTEVRSPEVFSLIQYVRTTLSIKSTSNPIYWTSFILLACPLRYVTVNLVTVWWVFLAPIVTRLWLYQSARRIYRKARRVLNS